MALKYKISKEEHGKLPDDLKGEYNLVGNDYVLDLDGGPDMKAGEKFTAERDKRRAAEKRANDAEARVTELEDQYSDGRTAVARAEKKATDAEAKVVAADKRFSDYARVKEVEGAANALANKLSKTAPKLILPHVMARMDVDLTDPAAPKLVIKGDDGKADPAMTLDKLEKNFRDNKDFAAIVTASHASGGGASRQGGANPQGNPAGGGNNQGGNPPGRVDLSTLSGADLASRIRAGREQQGLEVPAQRQQ